MAASVATAPGRLPPLPTIRDLVKLYRLRAIKQLSQNFLLEEKLNQKIVKAGGRVEGLYVSEVGPGPGGITRAILSRGAKKVILIEKDLRFKSMLNMLSQACPGKVDIHWGDVLAFNMSQLFPEETVTPWDSDKLPPIHIMGNLPFSVATPLIIRWLRDISNQENAWRYGRVPLTLTFQQEVAERLVADVMDLQRSRLSIMAQYLTQPVLKFTIAGKAFIPKPDVDVGVVKFIPRKVPLISEPFPVVEKVVRQIYSKKNRFSVKGASSLFPFVIRRRLAEEMYRRADINFNVLPTQLTCEEIGAICKAYLEICNEYPVRDFNNRAPKANDEWEKQHGHIYGYRADFSTSRKAKTRIRPLLSGPETVLDEYMQEEEEEDEEEDEDEYDRAIKQDQVVNLESNNNNNSNDVNTSFESTVLHK